MSKKSEEELPGLTIKEIRKYELQGEQELENTILNGSNYPKVEVYTEMDRNKGYQVSEEHGHYRETKVSDNPYEAQEYGEWKKLKDS